MPDVGRDARNIRMKYLLMALLAVAVGAAAERPAKNPKDFKGPKTSTSGETSTNDPVYIEYMKLLVMDDEAEKEVDQWIKDAEKFEEAGAGTSKAALSLKVEQRLKIVKDAYEAFILKHPKHPDVRLAYGSFLMDTHDEDEGVIQMEKGRELDPKNPAAWNNLANHYGHRGPVKKAFEYYEKAIELDPKEATYPWNFATTVYLFRRDAEEYYKINEPQVFDRAMSLYEQARRLDPTNLVLAVDLAQSYYGIKPMRTNDALAAWTNALALAKAPNEKQGIYLHLARVELNTGRWDESLQHLGAVDIPEMFELKRRLERNWIEKRDKALGTTNSAMILSNTIPSISTGGITGPRLIAPSSAKVN